MCNTANTNNYRSLWSRFLMGLALLFIAAIPPAEAATYLGKAEYLHHGGDPARVIDVVYVPLGYTDDWLYPAFMDLPRTMSFLNAFPFSSYQSFFNVHRLDAYSTITEEEALRSLAIQNLPDVDVIIFVLRDINSLISICGTDAVGCANMGRDVHIYWAVYDSVLVHELGHAIGYLVDEYEDNLCLYPNGAYAGVEPDGINVTINTDRSTIKWREWLGIAGVDLFEGAYHCSTGIYRPTSDCRMRTASSNFCPVCSEGLIRQINGRVSPFVSQTPSNRLLFNLAPQVMTFSVVTDATLRPQGATYTYEWYLDYQLVPGATGTSYSLDLGTLAPGANHTLRIIPVDPDINDFVRIANLGKLQAQETGWIISVTATAPTISSFSPNAGGAGTAVIISGTNFTGATAVKFNGTASAFQVISPTQINATVPADTSSGKISVTTPAGTVTSTGTFYLPPTIFYFSPFIAAVGTSVSIYGSNFCYSKCGYYNPANNETQVKLNGTSITPSMVFPGYIEFTLPAGATSGKFTITTPGGTVTSAGTFSVQGPPTISSFRPPSGPVGTLVEVSGTNFCGFPCDVSQIQMKLNGTSVTLKTAFPGYIQIVIPPGATSGKFTVTTPIGSATSTGTFTVTP